MFREIRKSIKVLIVAQTAYNFAMVFIMQYNLLFAEALGAGGTEIGLMIAISAIVQCSAAVLLGKLMDHYSFKKIILFGLLCDILALICFISGTTWYMLIPAFILYSQLVRQLPLTDIIIVTLTEPEKRATLMGFARIFLSASSIISPLMAAAVVNFYGGINAQGIRPLFYISLAITMLIFLVVLTSLEDIFLQDDKERGKRLQFSFSHLAQEYKDFLKKESRVRRWIPLHLSRISSHSMMAIFVPLWLVNVKGASPTILGIISAASAIAGMASQIPAGRMADKLSRKKAFLLFDIFCFLGSILLIIAVSSEYLILAGVLGWIGMLGGIGGATYVPYLTMWWESAPKESRGKMYGLEGIIMALARIPASTIGGILWDIGPKMLVMLIPLLVELFIVIPLMLMIPGFEETSPEPEIPIYIS